MKSPTTHKLVTEVFQHRARVVIDDGPLAGVWAWKQCKQCHKGFWTRPKQGKYQTYCCCAACESLWERKMSVERMRRYRYQHLLTP